MTVPGARPPTDPQTPVSPRLVLLLAVTCGAAVANLYYAQPLLHTIAQAFSVYEGTAGTFATVAARMALGSGRTFEAATVRARIGLVLDMPAGAAGNPDPLAPTITLVNLKTSSSN